MKHPAFHIVVALALLPAVSSPAGLTWKDAPLSGMAYNTVERSAVTYDCSAVTSAQIQCRFVQTAVRRKLDYADLPSKIAEAEADLANWEASEEECKDIEKYRSELEAKAASADKSFDQRDVDVAREVYTAIEAACRSGSRAGLSAMVQRSLERDTRTCRVSSHTFEQTFTRQSSASTPVWVTTGAPSGPCGIVQLSRFESADAGEGYLWNYVARKAVTNPSGELPLLGSCKSLDEETYHYSWRSTDGPSSWADCDQLEFGLF